jgi:hypothetical protein
LVALPPDAHLILDSRSMPMINRRISRGTTLLALVILSVPAWARSTPDNSLRKMIVLNSDTQVEGKMLKAGQYELTVNGNQASFESAEKIITEVPCTWKTLEKKAAYDSEIYDQNTLAEIQLNGKTQAIDFATAR